MTDFALIKDGQIVRVQAFEDAAPALAANKGVWLPIVNEDADFDPATQVCEPVAATVEADRVVMAAPVRDKTDVEVAAMRAAKVAAIKEIAGARILALYPSWRQTNMLARGFELTYRRFAGALTQDEEAEVASLQASWDEVKAIREASNALEAAIPADAAGVFGFDPSEGWD